MKEPKKPSLRRMRARNDGSKHGWETVDKEGTGGWEERRLGARKEAARKAGHTAERMEASKAGRIEGLTERNAWKQGFL